MVVLNTNRKLTKCCRCVCVCWSFSFFKVHHPVSWGACESSLRSVWGINTLIYGALASNKMFTSGTSSMFQEIQPTEQSDGCSHCFCEWDDDCEAYSGISQHTCNSSSVSIETPNAPMQADIRHFLPLYTSSSFVAHRPQYCICIEKKEHLNTDVR